MSNSSISLRKLEYRWNLLSIRQRRSVRSALTVIFTITLVAVVFDFLYDFPNKDTPNKVTPNNEPPVTVQQNNRPDHYWGDLILGVAGLSATFVSILVLLKVSSRETNTLGEYLDIFNDILEDVKHGEHFYILSPAHNAGQKDATSDDIMIKRKYEKNQQLLQEKVKIAIGEYTLLEYHPRELEVFTNDNDLAARIRFIEDYLVLAKQGENVVQASNYSLLFKFLMKFSKDARNEAGKKDDHKNIIQNYMATAFGNLQTLMLGNFRVNGINKATYLQAPMVLIISKRMGYFGQYKLTEVNNKADIIIRGITITDEHGINSLKVLYDAVTDKFSTTLKQAPIPDNNN